MSYFLLYFRFCLLAFKNSFQCYTAKAAESTEATARATLIRLVGFSPLQMSDRMCKCLPLKVVCLHVVACWFLPLQLCKLFKLAAAVATVRAAVLASARLSRCHSEKYALGAFKNFISAQPGTSGAATLSKKHLSLFHILPRQAYAYSFHLRTQYAVFSIVCQRCRLLNWGT